MEVHVHQDSSRPVALVTGGTSGIGRSIAASLIAEGATVHILGSNAEKGAAAQRALGGSSHFIQLDLSDLRAVRDFARRFAAGVHRLDTLVHVAGVVLQERQETVDGYEKTLTIDHLAAYLLSRELRTLMARAPHPRILNVSAPASQVLNAEIRFDDLHLKEGYSFTRATVQGLHAKTVMTQVLAERFAAEGIDVNAFDPGAVRSDLSSNLRFPLRQVMRFAQLFMPTVSKTGVYASTAAELNGVTGQFINGRERTPLQFDLAYTQRVADVTESLIERALT